jgi:hypothetical protein
MTSTYLPHVLGYFLHISAQHSLAPLSGCGNPPFYAVVSTGLMLQRRVDLTHCYATADSFRAEASAQHFSIVRPVDKVIVLKSRQTMYLSS